MPGVILCLVFIGLDTCQILTYVHLTGIHVLKNDNYFYWPFLAEQLIGLCLVFAVAAKHRNDPV